MAGRLEDERLLRGTTRFVRDLEHDDCAHVVFVRSQVAAGAIERIDTTQALTAPGVVAVLTADDLDLADFSYFVPVPDDVARPPLATERVRMVGELLAAVVADTEALAIDAAELVEVDIDAEDPVIDPRSATAATSPLVFDRPLTDQLLFEFLLIKDLFMGRV